MIKTKEKACLILAFLAILVIVGLIFCGCKQSNVFCYFVSEDEIVLMTNSTLSTKELKIESNTQYEIFWDNNIIEYDGENGKIIAKNEGKTKFTISYKKDGKTKTQSVSVVVIKPVFAISIELYDNYVFYEGAGETKFDCNILTQSGEKYNLDVWCESSNPMCFQTNKNLIIPQKEGSAEVVVKAISGYNEATNEFLYIQKSVVVHIVKQLTSVDVKICDNNKQELEHQNNISLFGGIGVNRPDYYIKLTANNNISHYKVEKANESLNWNICGDMETYYFDSEDNINQDGFIFVGDKTLFVPIKVQNNGSFDVSLKFLKQNDEAVFVSNPIDVSSHNYLSEKDIKVYSSNVYKTKEDMSGVQDASFVELSQNLQSGKYEIFKITDNANYYNLAIQNKKYFYGIICFDNFDATCYNEINAEANNLKLEKISQNKFYFEALESGNASIFISAVSIDNKTFLKTLEFSVENVLPTSFSYVADRSINMTIDEEKDFALTNVLPVYANVELLIELENNNGVLEIDGTKVVAKSYGNEKVIITACSQHFEYNISVEPENDISVQIVNMEHETTYYVELEVLGTDLNIVSVSVDGDDEAECPIFSNTIFVTSSVCFSQIRIIINTSGVEVCRIVVVDWENT